MCLPGTTQDLRGVRSPENRDLALKKYPVEKGSVLIKTLSIVEALLPDLTLSFRGREKERRDARWREATTALSRLATEGFYENRTILTSFH